MIKIKREPEKIYLENDVYYNPETNKYYKDFNELNEKETVSFLRKFVWLQ